MQPAAFQDGLQLHWRPTRALASQIVQGSAGHERPDNGGHRGIGLFDAGEHGVDQAAGVTNPTVLDARAYYNFGPNAGCGNGAGADPSETMMSDDISLGSDFGGKQSSAPARQWLNGDVGRKLKDR